jgi:hypothetical protein
VLRRLRVYCRVAARRNRGFTASSLSRASFLGPCLAWHASRAILTANVIWCSAHTRETGRGV